MRICYLIYAFYRSGAETLVYSLATRLARRHDVIVGSLYEAGNQEKAKLIREELRRGGVRTFQIGKISGQRRIQALYRLTCILRTERPDILHAHTLLPNVYGRIAGALAGVPVRIVTLHSGGDDLRRQRNYCMERLSLPLATQYVAVSSIPAGYFKERFGRKHPLIIIPNGVDVDRFCNMRFDRDVKRLSLELSASNKVLINVARIDGAKGQEYLIEAVRMLKPSYPDLKVLIVGDTLGNPALTDRLERMIQLYDLRNNVRILGSRSDIPELLAISDLFVFPSLFEAQSIALLEAMASGLPVVASKIPAVEEMIADGKEGRLFPIGDASALASAICELLTNQAFARQLADKAREKVREHYTIEATVKSYENLYCKLTKVNHEEVKDIDHLIK